MRFSPILVVGGEPNSIFSEIFIKSINKTKFKRPIILIYSLNLLNKQMKQLKLKKDIKVLDPYKIKKYNLNNKSINLINVNYNQNKPFQKISKKTKSFISECFTVAFELIKKEKITKLINGPISKKNFLENKFLGMTEYISDYFSVPNNCMLIFNKNLSVCPVTTHMPLKLVSKNISQKIIYDKIILISKFYKNYFNTKPKIAVLGLNPHCESIHKYNEDEKIINPLVKKMRKKKFKIYGPLSADTIFLKNNRKKYDVIIGMYHDQVLTPIKTLFEYDAINITLGLPFLRLSPDHGPNQNMMGKNLSNPLSLIKSLEFLDKY